MKKIEMIRNVSLMTGFSNKKTDLLVDTIIEAIVERLANGEKVSINGFGYFEVRRKKERVSAHPRNADERLLVREQNSVFFKASPQLKTKVIKG